VAIINETAAKRYFAGRSAIGGYVTMGKRSMQIVGVSRDTKNHELSETPSPYIYMPLLQLSENAVGALTLVVRVKDGFRSTRSIVDAARSANPAVPIFDVATMSQRLHFVLAPQLVGAWLLGSFGVLALIVAAIGIYGVVAYAVSQRTREIGIRMALGARAASVLGLVVRGNVAFVAVGIPIGIALGLMLARAMARFLYGLRPTDPLTFAVTSFTILAVGALAAFVPARRAVRIDPLIALRSDD
jgi:ABC-type antimicrobial peptide transport system permease subunit